VSSQSSPILEIDCDELFDGHKLVKGARIRVEGGRISSIDTTPAEPRVPSSDRPAPLRVAFAMPGLVDAHVHISGYREGMPAGAPFEPVKTFVRSCLYNGVTTLRDTGNTLETILYLRKWTAKNNGPRIFGSGPLLDTPPLTWPFSRVVQTKEDARHHVECLRLETMDLVKSYVRITPELLGAIVESATEAGLPVASDCSATTPRQAAHLGVTSLEHVANLLDEEMLGGTLAPGLSLVERARAWSRVELESRGVASLIDLLLERQTVVCPTLLVSRRWCLVEEMVNDPYLDYAAAVMPYHKYFKRLRGPVGMTFGGRYMRQYMPIPNLSRSELAEVQLGLLRMGDMTRLLIQAGVRVVAGTDSPNPSLAPGFSLHQELAEMVRHGIPAEAVLASATSAAAALLRQTEAGVVRPGANADLLLLDASPLDDMANLARIHTVVCRGQLIDRGPLLGHLKEAMEAA
jgi:imidazolonepropionase-like amidohydrolase